MLDSDKEKKLTTKDFSIRMKQGSVRKNED